MTFIWLVVWLISHTPQVGDGRGNIFIVEPN
jgi:hypothetical protein